jgi:hypothetical protein
LLFIASLIYHNMPLFLLCCLQDMRVVFVDGTVLDTADPNSRESFLRVSSSDATAVSAGARAAAAAVLLQQHGVIAG